MNTSFVYKITNFLFLFALFASCIAIILSSVLLMMKKSGETKSDKASQNQEQRNSSYIVTLEDHIVMDFSKSNYAEFGVVVLGNPPISDYTDGFSFSYLDLDKNELEKSPVEVTEVKADKKNGWHTVTVSAQTTGAYYIRISHRLAAYSTDVLIVVTAGKNI